MIRKKLIKFINTFPFLPSRLIKWSEVEDLAIHLFASCHRQFLLLYTPTHMTDTLIEMQCTHMHMQCTHIYTCMHTHAYTCIHACTHMTQHIRTCIQSHIQHTTITHTHMHTHPYARTHTHACTQIHTYWFFRHYRNSNAINFSL